MLKKLLLIDYEPRSVERIKAVLSPDYALTFARDGEEGLALAAGARFDAVLVASMLPRMPSGEVIREIRRKGGATAPPILLLMSGYKGNNTKADAQRVGAFDILVRPFSDDSLREIVRSAIDATDLSAATARVALADVASAPGLTASDIFADVLEDVRAEAPPPVRTAPPGRVAPPADSDVERRLRDTLSGIAPRSPARTGHAAGPAPAPSPSPESPSPAASKFSTDADIDRMISDTLSGLKIAARPRVAPPSSDPSPGPSRTGVGSSPAAANNASLREAPADAPPPPTEASRAPEPAGVSGSGPDRFGQYEILERIASGGMAELYKARRSGEQGFQKIVAIKKILPHLADNEEFIAMFADEAKLAAQLNHPNIVHIYDLGKIDAGGYYIAMEHVEGHDLRAILESGRELGSPLPVPLAVYVASKVASALDYAHRRREPDGRVLNIVHRDVSPQNILISFEGDIKLCDFGIAKAASKVTQTESGALKGKVPYMSPEQAWGKALDRRSDLFSLGVVLYEMLTEQRLFRGDSDLTVLEKVRAAVVAPPSALNPEIPKPLDSVVLRALAREPDDRYANASDMLRDLETVLYSSSPAPGSADLAFYLHRLRSEESSMAETRQREASHLVEEGEPKRSRSKVAPVERRADSSPRVSESSPPVAVPGPPPPPPPPAPRAPAAAAPVFERVTSDSGVFGSFTSRQVAAERKSRTKLYATIAIAAMVLLAGTVWFTLRGRSPSGLPQAPPTAVPATPSADPAAARVSPPPDPAAAGFDSGTVEDEVARQLAVRKKEMKRALEAEARRTPRDAARTPAAAAAVADPEPALPPTVVPDTPPAEPSPEPTEPPPPPTAMPRPTPPPEPEVTRGELVGPGPGVVEPALLTPPHVLYPPMARQQRVAGKVIILVLVDENGNVAEGRIQQGIASRMGVNEAVLDAVRKAKFRAPTKLGVPVKMWRTVVVDVKP